MAHINSISLILAPHHLFYVHLYLCGGEETILNHEILIKPMEKVLELIENLKKSEVKKLIDARIKEFEENGRKPGSEIFKELCFCILTANFDAGKCIKIQNDIGEGFLTLSESQLAERLKESGHRHPNVRSRYIVEAREYKNSLKDVIKFCNNDTELREYLVKNIKGIGYKEASHFLRNIGYKNLAIIDFHIINILTDYGLIEEPKSLTKRKYMEIEGLLKEIAGESGINLAELDLYLWFAETKKILK